MTLLFDEEPRTFSARLAEAIGLNEALLLQQVHYRGKLSPPERWVRRPLSEWLNEDFPFLSERTIKRAFASLVSQKLLEKQQPGMNRTAEYRVDLAGYLELVEKRLSRATGQIGLLEGATMASWSGPDWPDGRGQIGPLPSSRAQEGAVKKTAEETPPDPLKGETASCWLASLDWIRATVNETDDGKGDAIVGVWLEPLTAVARDQVVTVDGPPDRLGPVRDRYLDLLAAGVRVGFGEAFTVELVDDDRKLIELANERRRVDRAKRRLREAS
jgi:hypothetical protein